MDKYRSISRSAFALRLSFLVVSVFLIPLAGVRADESETWSRMLDGLKARKYFDTALDYLVWMNANPHCPPSLKGQIDYQIAGVHLAAIEQRAMFLRREEHAAKCREALEKYLKENANGDFVFEAVSTQGRLLMEEGRTNMARADAETTREADREPLREGARETFRQALLFFEEADGLATARARELQEARQANAAAVKDEVLDDAYGRFLTGKILVNLTKLDIAKTFPPDSEEFKNGITAVAEDFARLGKRYESFLAGLQMRLYAAKSYRELGNFKAARDILGELNVSGDTDILTESLLLALDMNLTEATPEGLADSAGRVRGWNDNSPAANKLRPEGQQIFLLGAKNLIAYADTVRDRRADHDGAMRLAGAFLRQVRPTSPQSREAQDILRGLSGVEVDRTDPQTFTEARDFAEEDWRDFYLAHMDWQDAKTPEEQRNARARLEEVSATCVASFNRAINMREEGTPIAEVNKIRANLARLHAVFGRHLEAAILSDYLAQRYSGDHDAEKTAGLAVRLYRQVFVEDKRAGYETAAVAARLSNLCDFIMKRWEGREVTGEVRLLQIDTAIDSGDLDAARAFLAETPEGTPQRAAAELRIGQSLWNHYAVAVRLPDEAEGKPNKQALDAMLAEARQQLEKGLNGKIKLIESGDDSVNLSAVISAMLLGQIYMNIDNAQGAVDWMTNKHVGPMTLMDAPPPGVEIDDTMKLNCTMIILRAYVATENLDRAEQTMDKLEALIKEQTVTGSDDPEEKLAAERRLTQIYVTLGRQLENRLKELNDVGEFEQAKKVADGFERFLTRIKDRGDANSFQSLYWVADTFYRLGSGLTTEGRKPPPEAENYYRQAGQTYLDIKKRLVDEPTWAPDRAEKTIDMRLAESLRGIGQYAGAMRFLTVILKDEGNRLDAQIEAATTLEEWGAVEPKKLSAAIQGGDPDPSIWGLNRIIRQTSSDVERFGDIYYNAYLSRLRCRLAMYKAETDSTRKERILDYAKRDLEQLLTLRPLHLGGPELFARFDQVYRNLQRAEGINRPKTLKDFQQEVRVEIPVVQTTEREEASSRPVVRPKESPASKPASDMTMWIVLVIAAVVCIPLVYKISVK